MTEPIASSILDWLKEDIAALKAGDEEVDEPVRRTSPLMQFVQQTFTQAFHGKPFGLKISSFSQAGKEEVLLAAAAAENLGEPMRELVDLYVDVCNVWPDVLSQSYGGSSADFFEFRTQLVPEVLKTLTGLARERDYAELLAGIEPEAKNYSEALEVARERKPDS